MASKNVKSKKKVQKKVTKKDAKSVVAESISKKAQLEAQTVPLKKVTDEQAQQLATACNVLANVMEAKIKEIAKSMGIEASISVYLNIKNYSKKAN